MGPYRSPGASRNEAHRPWPLPVLFVAAAIAWWLVEHAIGSVGGRFLVH